MCVRPLWISLRDDALQLVSSCVLVLALFRACTGFAALASPVARVLSASGRANLGVMLLHPALMPFFHAACTRVLKLSRAWQPPAWLMRTEAILLLLGFQLAVSAIPLNAGLALLLRIVRGAARVVRGGVR